MEYVRYKMKRFWATPDRNEYEVHLNGVYFWPYFIDANCRKIVSLSQCKSDWVKEFDFISRDEFLKEADIDSNLLELIEELLGNHPEARGLDHSNTILALEILKTTNYGKKSIKK